MTLYPWHICNSKCLWWAPGQTADYCNREIEVVPADTGRPGCFYWLCSACGYSWEDGEDHEDCMRVELLLDN